MRYFLFILLITTLIGAGLSAQTVVPPCKEEKEIRNQHIIRYRAVDGSARGCLVPAKFFTEIKKQRARLTGAKKLEICEGNYLYSPRIGDSFGICPLK